MLSLAKLGRFAEEYYLAAVAMGAEDYYVGRGEAPGQWMGRGAELLGLAGEVAGDDLRAVLGGTAPDGRQLGVGNRRVAGFDLTFSVPKSVSVLAALRPELDAQITEISEQAVRRTLAWLEDVACVSRRGHNGTSQVVGDGFVAATFRHRTSRDADPQLHWHVVVANTTRGPDGNWRTLDGSQLYPIAKTAGYLFEAQLRHDLTAAMGIEWHAPINGIADMAGLPFALLQVFSKRRAAIDESLSANGWTSARAAQMAAYATRRAKGDIADHADLVTRWATEAREHGWEPALFDRAVNRSVARPDREQLREFLGEWFVAADGITQHRGTFARSDALRFVANAVANGITIDEAEAVTDELLRRHDVVALGHDLPSERETIRRPDGTLLAPGRRIERYSTVELMDLERHSVELCASAVHSAPHISRAALADSPTFRRLSAEQASAVEGLVTSPYFCDVLIAPAGSGKTFSLRAANEAWTAQGIRVIGATLAGRAAKELSNQAGIASGTIASTLTRLEKGQLRLDQRTVLVIDEAAMAGTRDLHRLLAAAHQAQAKVVMVGDHRQLQSIDAGGLLKGLADRIFVFELTENRRQRHLWEQGALRDLRDGDPDRFLELYRSAGRVTSAPDHLELRQRVVDDWRRFTDRGRLDVRILALHRIDIAYFNRAVRRVRLERGELTGSALHVGTLEFQVGDEILTLRNNRRLGLVNGERGVVSAIDHERRDLRMRLPGGEERTIPNHYLADGFVDHGYASTIHKAQGLTADVALVYGTEDLNREALYTALSRAREHTQLYVTAEPVEREIERPHAPTVLPAQEEIDYLLDVLERMHPQTLAIDSAQRYVDGLDLF